MSAFIRMTWGWFVLAPTPLALPSGTEPVQPSEYSTVQSYDRF